MLIQIFLTRKLVYNLSYNVVVGSVEKFVSNEKLVTHSTKRSIRLLAFLEKPKLCNKNVKRQHCKMSLTTLSNV